MRKDSVNEVARKEEVNTSPEDREIILKKMQQASDTFYAMAVRIGFHQFLEFNGFLVEYIKGCRAAHEDGIDFTTESIPFKDHQMKYVAEKMDCIFGDALFEPANMQAFVSELSDRVSRG